MSDSSIILVGYSGHGIVVAEAALMCSLPLIGYAEFDAVSSNAFNLEYLGFEGDTSFSGWEGNHSFILGLGNNYTRLKVTRLIESKGKRLLNIQHPSASVSQIVQMGNGNFIARNVVINPLVTIGSGCILNTGSIIEHECSIGDFVHIAPGAVLAGNVSIGNCTFIGANSVVKQGIKIGQNVVIGAGTVVIKDINDPGIYVGNPAKKI